MLTIVNSGRRGWTLPGLSKLLPGESRSVAADVWRLALDLNKALGAAVALGEVQVEDDTPPAPAPVVVESAPEPEKVSEREEPATRPIGKRRRNR